MYYFFFFKQKTAYEMRISDWSSDVCSSDLDPLAQAPGGAVGRLRRGAARPRGVGAEGQRYRQQADAAADRTRQRRSLPQRYAARRAAPAPARLVARGAATGHHRPRRLALTTQARRRPDTHTTIPPPLLP